MGQEEMRNYIFQLKYLWNAFLDSGYNDMRKLYEFSQKADKRILSDISFEFIGSEPEFNDALWLSDLIEHIETVDYGLTEYKAELLLDEINVKQIVCKWDYYCKPYFKSKMNGVFLGELEKRTYYKGLYDIYITIKQHEEQIIYYKKNTQNEDINFLYRICRLFHIEIEPIINEINDTINPKSLTDKQYNSVVKRGRPTDNITSRMIEDEDGRKLNKIRSLMKGKKGKDATLIILAAIKKGWMLKPTFNQVEKEFGDIGARQGYNSYLDERKYKDDELEMAMKLLVLT